MFKANLSLLVIILVIFAVSMVKAEDALDGKTLASIRFENGPESYAGKP